MLTENHGRQKEEKERREEPVFSFLFRSFYPKFKISCPHMFTCFYPLTNAAHHAHNAHLSTRLRVDGFLPRLHLGHDFVVLS